jgi:hypothetical protein
MISRRGLITGLISLAAAPAIVRASSLMPVKIMEPIAAFEWSPFYTAIPMSPELAALLNRRIDAAYAMMRKHLEENIVAELLYTSKGTDPLGSLFDGR